MVNLDAHERYFLEIEERQQLSMGLYTTQELMTHYAREKFMAVIAYDFPQCVEGLKLILCENLNIVQTLLNKTKHRYPSTLEEILQYEEGELIYEYIFQWCSFWNLVEQWIIENALIAICSWFNNIDLLDQVYLYNHPQRQKHAEELANKLRKEMEKDPTFPKPPRVYCPLVDKSRKEYQEMQLKYMEQVDSLYEKYGFIKTITKRKDPQKHFRWLAQYQLMEWNTNKIVEEHIKRNKDEENLTSDSVKKEIRKVANLLKLKIR